MNGLEHEIFSAVKADNIEVFSSRVAERRGILSYSFGRFPLLSLCYLYNAKKIIKNYQTELNSVINYTVIEEPFEVYSLFKSIAGRALRLYTGGRFVSPAEMLAIMEESLYLKDNYRQFSVGENTAKSIEYIYAVNHGEKISADTDSVKIKNIKLDLKQKLIILLIIVFAIAFAALPLPIFNLFTDTFGGGTFENPFTVSNVKQLKTALGGNSFYKLTADIVVPETWVHDKFAGTLIGNGHKITVQSNVAFINELTGKIENVNFVKSNGILLSDTAYVINETTLGGGVVVNMNRGIITSCSLSFDSTIVENITEKTIYFGLFAAYNNREISSCTVSYNIAFDGNGEGDACFGGFAGVNAGDISNGIVTDESGIETDTVDIGGIAGENSNTGTIRNCKNYASLLQTADREFWSPNVAGITMRNFNKISDCVNYGSIKATSNFDSEGAEEWPAVYTAGLVCINNYTLNSIKNCRNYGEIYAEALGASTYAGGLTSINYGVIEKSRNDGNITSISDQRAASAGGITAVGERGENSSTIPKITDSGAVCSLTVFCNNTTYYCFAGGISGIDLGTIQNCFSACTFNEQAEYSAFGGIFGAGYDLGYTVSTNNFYVQNMNISFGTGRIFVFDQYYGVWRIQKPTPDTTLNPTLLENIAALNAHEVYWE